MKRPLVIGILAGVFSFWILYPQSGGSLAHGKPPEEAGGDLQPMQVSGPYCGITSLYACLSSLGVEVEPTDFVSTAYVGSPQGSSIQELIRGANDHGTNAECFANLTYRDLLQIDQPAILHMRSNWLDGAYNHWVAFLGFDGRRVRVVDAPRPLETITVAELLANWDGTAVIVSRQPIEKSFVLAARLDYLASATILLLAIYFVRRAFSSRSMSSVDTGSYRPGFKHLAGYAVALVAAAVLLGVGYHMMFEIGFLRNPTAVAEVTRRYYSVDIPELSTGQVESEMLKGEALILDSRRAYDFRGGSLPGAVSMPVHSSLSERQAILADVPRGRRIIVYCQSAGCRYADHLARFLKFNGYANLALYRGGYREWQQDHGQTGAGVRGGNVDEKK